MSSTPGSKGPSGADAPDDAAPVEGGAARSAIRRPTPQGLAPAGAPLPSSSDKPTLAPRGITGAGLGAHSLGPGVAPPRAPPPRPIPRAILDQPRVVQGARAPGLPAPAPPPPSALALPKLQKPDKAGPTPLPPRPVGSDMGDELDSLEVELDDKTEMKAPSEPPRRVAKTGSLQLPAICTYGRFEILGRIAFGGMAEIFLGRESSQVGASRLLAIKRILPHVADDPQFVEMFLDEARLAIQLSHPHICHIYEFGELEGTYFIAMEWIHGAQLGKLIRKARSQGGLAPEVGARIVAYVAEALHYAHRARDANGEPMGIVHRDVSPHNVMVSYEGQVKLLDFGIAKAQTHTTKTQAGVIKGKFSYMSPQQCLGKNIDARADVFALGICLYENADETLYARATEYETMRAVIEDPVPSVRDLKPDLPIELDAIVQRALQKKPEDRFRSAGEMQAAIEDWLAATGRAITPSRIGDVMQKVFEEQALAGPLVDSTPFGASFRRRQVDGMPAGMGSSSGVAPRIITSTGVERVDGSGEKATVTSGRSQPRADAITGGATDPDMAGRASIPDDEELAPRRRGWATLAIALAALGTIGAVVAVVMTQGGSEEISVTTPAVAPTAAPTTATETGTETAAVEDETPTPIEPAIVAPAEGTVRVRVATPGAIVRVGDRAITAEELDTAIAIAPGMHIVHVEHPDFRPWDREIEITAGAESVVEPELVPRERTPAAPPGRISINTRPWSKVYVGSRLLGTTPIGEASVPSGNVRLRIVDRDGRTFSRSVRVAPGAQESVFFNLDE